MSRADRREILVVFGTRPEAIKLCPVVLHMRREHPEFTVKVCVTAQHRHLLDQVLEVFQVQPDYDLDCMRSNQSLFHSTSNILLGLERVLLREKPELLVVQGDTTSTLCGALAGFYTDVPVAHVEAGLRTGDLHEPFPEELNRVLVGRIASLHFAPTEVSAQNLYAEGIAPEAITVTGNTGIDAVFFIRDRLHRGLRPAQPLALDPQRKLVLVTAHRRESFGDGFEEICSALAEVAVRPDVQIVYPVHPNPNVQDPVNRHLRGNRRVILIEPMEYVSFVALLMRCSFVLTDSGGIQEEAPSLGKPVLVMRDKTERPEAVLAGTARLVGPRRERIVAECNRLLDDPRAYESMAQAHNPYGDGRASERIGRAIWQFLGETCSPVPREPHRPDLLFGQEVVVDFEAPVFSDGTLDHAVHPQNREGP
jgi:UDP-N-acetylglucosamine 2-epimerase (non-hydrolysing)